MRSNKLLGESIDKVRELESMLVMKQDHLIEACQEIDELERQVSGLRAAMGEILKEVGTSTLTNKIVLKALAEFGDKNEP